MSEPRTKHDLAIEIWERLDCESVGAPELEAIQRALGERFGTGAVESPAAIARTLADEGAVLRHPEVLECDAQWRERKLDESPATSLKFETLAEAAASLKKIDGLSVADSEVRHIRAAIQNVRKDCLLVSRSVVIDDQKRLVAKEIAEWLRVWLSAPVLFADWLELRRRSSDFVETFHAKAQRGKDAK
jgi:hypothetical protein